MTLNIFIPQKVPLCPFVAQTQQLAVWYHLCNADIYHLRQHPFVDITHSAKNAGLESVRLFFTF